MPYQRQARAVLEQWRSVERRLSEVAEHSVEAALLRAQADVLRHEYQHLIDEAQARDRPEPPPFPDLDPDGHELGDGPDLSFRR